MRTIWTIPTGIPKTVVIIRGARSASSIIAMLQPVVSPGRVMNPAMVSAIIPQTKRKTSRLCSTCFTLNGRMRTQRKIIKRPPFTRRSMLFTILPACKGQRPIPDQE